MQKKESNKTSWGGVAGWYDDLLEGDDDSFQSKVIMPNLLRILDPKPGINILDIACGQGYFARAYAQNGAKVVGCDISPELVRLAISRNPKTAMPPTYHAAPASAMPFVPSDSQDAATIVLALQNIEDLLAATAEAARTLRKGGRLIIVLNHPAFRIPQRSSWQWDEGGTAAAPRLYRRLDGYMSDARLEIDMTPGEPVRRNKTFTVSFHRPLQVYFKALTKSGLAVTRLEEWLSHRSSQKRTPAIRGRQDAQGDPYVSRPGSDKDIGRA